MADSIQEDKKNQAKADIREQIELIEKMNRKGFLSDDDMKEMIGPLRQKLHDLSTSDQ